MTRLALVLALGCLVLVPSALAIDRPMELLLGDMMPAGGSRNCLRDLTRELRDRDHAPINVTRMGAASVRRIVGDEEGPFLDWTADDLRPLLERRRETRLDAIALVDCRVDDSVAEMLLLSPAGGVARVALRRAVIDEERARWLGRTLMLHVNIGFDP